MRLDSFFSGALCVLSGGRLPEALLMVFYWIPKVQQYVNRVDLVKSFLISIQCCIDELMSFQSRVARNLRISKYESASGEKCTKTTRTWR